MWFLRSILCPSLWLWCAIHISHDCASSLWAAAGLRSLYFLLIAAQNMFWALEKAVMILLVFVSGKLIGNAFDFHISNTVSLSVVATILGGGVIYSLLFDEETGKLKK